MSTISLVRTEGLDSSSNNLPSVQTPGQGASVLGVGGTVSSIQSASEQDSLRLTFRPVERPRTLRDMAAQLDEQSIDQVIANLSELVAARKENRPASDEAMSWYKQNRPFNFNDLGVVLHIISEMGLSPDDTRQRIVQKIWILHDLANQFEADVIPTSQTFIKGSQFIDEAQLNKDLLMYARLYYCANASPPIKASTYDGKRYWNDMTVLHKYNQALSCPYAGPNEFFDLRDIDTRRIVHKMQMCSQWYERFRTTERDGFYHALGFTKHEDGCYYMKSSFLKDAIDSVKQAKNGVVKIFAYLRGVAERQREEVTFQKRLKILGDQI